MTEPKRYSISISRVKFADGTGSKTRPVYILKFDDAQIKVLRLTTKYASKSKRIQEKYFEIFDWHQAGLREPSWIDTVQSYNLSASDFGIHFIGYLTLRDQMRLEEFLKGSDFENDL